MFFTLFLIKFLTFFTLFFCGCVISSRNPAHSAFSLVMVFLLNACILFLLNIKFLAFTLIILYAGAVSILFLFIIFTMNMKEKEQDLSTINYFIIYSTTFKLFLVSIESKNFLLYKINNIFFNLKSLDDLGARLYDTDVTDLYLIGWLFYEKFYIIFIFIGIILFAAMLAIILLIKPFLPQGLSFKKC